MIFNSQDDNYNKDEDNILFSALFDIEMQKLTFIKCSSLPDW